MSFTKSQTVAISSLASIAGGFSSNFFDGGRDARRLKSLGVDPSAEPPKFPDTEAMDGTLAEVPPAAVMGALKVISDVDDLMHQPNPFADDGSTLGDAINRLAIASR